MIDEFALCSFNLPSFLVTKMKCKPTRNPYSNKKSKQGFASPCGKLHHPPFSRPFTMMPYYVRPTNNNGCDYSNATSNNRSNNKASFSRMNAVLSSKDTSNIIPGAPSYFDGRYPMVKYTDNWACDYCQVATFATYQEACHHEQRCKMNFAMIQKDQEQISPNSLAPSVVKSTVSSSSSPSHDEAKLLLCMPTDKQSLSDRQCYVRSKFVEIFEATEADVSTRHSRGAQKLHVGQIGIRCIHCSHLETRKRAERATCFPSSISRIYQTVADMQRFHFEVCTGIPESMKNIYRNLKTTRPRGQGSPQSYWIKSAKDLGLVDTNEGIRLSKEGRRGCLQQWFYHSMFNSNYNSSTSSQTATIGGSSSYPTSPFTREQQGMMHLPPLSPESQSSQTTTTTSSVYNHIPDEEDANILLALRTGNVSQSTIDSSTSRQSQ